MTDASTAILIKSRAKYGKHLTKRDYDELLNCRTISDITAYLHSNTHYSVSLNGIKEAAVHRGNLELLLKGKIFDDFSTLCKFESSIGEHYFEYIITKQEVENLLIFLRYYISGISDKFLFSIPAFFSKHSKIDFVGITKCKNFDEILDILKPTKYYKLILPFHPHDGKSIDFTMIESVLVNFVYEYAQDIITNSFSGKEKDEMRELFAFSAEIDNIRRIYRAKKYFDCSPDMIRALINNQRSILRKSKLEELINCENANDIIPILKTTRYRNFIRNIEFTYIDELADRILYKYYREKMRFSTNSAVVMAATIFLFEIEIENLTTIIEGKRYNVESDNIKKLLIMG